MRSCVILLMLVVVSSHSAAGFAASAAGQGATVAGHVVDASAAPLPGATVTLTCGAGTPQVATTDGTGAYAFAAAASKCTITAALDGFDPATREVAVDVRDLTIDLTLQVSGVKETVTVGGGQASAMAGTEAGQAATVDREVIHNAPLPNGRVDDVMPLIPSVLRGPDGIISMAGARGTQSALLVNGGRETDPVTGEFGIDLPLESVESVEVFPTGYAAEFGQATGSVARIRTRRGEDQLKASLNSLDPRIRFEHGTTRGVESWTPHLGLSGPIAKGHAWFAQSLDYAKERTPIDTLAVDGREDSRLNSLTSLSQIDWHIGPRHDLTASLAAQRQTIQGANLAAFTPTPTRPRVGTSGFSLAVNDRLTLGPSSLLESTLQVKRSQLDVAPTGDEPYEIGHDLTRGNYFNSQDRTAYRTELTEQYTRTSTGPYGPRLLRLGASIGYSTYDGTNVSRPVTLRRSDGTISRMITFAGPMDQQASAYDVGLYAAQRWRVSRWVMIDAGGRLDAASGVGPVISPRLEWTLTLPFDPRTTLKGGAGLFADKLVLGARSFDHLQSRIVQSYDANGQPLGAPIVYTNRREGDLTLPKAALWNVEVNRELGAGWRVRVNVQQRDGKDELVVAPRLLTPESGVLALSSTGDSDAWNVETTLGYTDRERGHQAYVSYVRGSARGNLNDLNSIEGNFKEPFVQADAIGPLRFDVPNRVLAWGLLSLPRQITVAPFMEWRSGFPYSAVDESWNYVEPRNSQRFPQFFSLDLVVNKWIRLPWVHVPARVGFSLYNLTGQRNGRDVQVDIERLDFGQTYNKIHRRLRGQFEIDWGGRNR